MSKSTVRQRPTLRDIAKLTGVSAATVSYVLNGKGSVGADVQQLVRETAKDLGYRANHAAKATRTGQTLSIGLILPDLNNPFFPQLAQAVQAGARGAGYAVFLVDSEGSVDVEREGAEDLIGRSIALLRVGCQTIAMRFPSSWSIDRFQTMIQFRRTITPGALCLQSTFWRWGMTALAWWLVRKHFRAPSNDEMDLSIRLAMRHRSLGK